MVDFKRAVVAAALAVSLAATGAARAATIDADLMFVVDGSGSMADDFTDLGAGMTTFVNALQADARIGTVRVGLVRYSLNPLLQINLTTDLTVFTGLSRGKGNRDTENPLRAIDFAVTNSAIAYRPDAVRTIILITDEEGNDFGTYANAHGTGVSALNMLLDDLGFLNNIIHNPGKRGSTANYGQIARPYGALFDIADFRADPMSFLTAFAKVKIQEFVDVRTPPGPQLSAVPLPAGVWLLLCGLGAFAAVRRRQKPRPRARTHLPDTIPRANAPVPPSTPCKPRKVGPEVPRHGELQRVQVPHHHRRQEAQADRPSHLIRH